MNEYRFINDSRVRDQHLSWQVRIVLAGMGTTSGSIAMAMLAKRPKVGPALGPTAEIAPDGGVYTMLRIIELNASGQQVSWRMEYIGHIVAVRDNMRRLADHCQLSDKDRQEMFEELRKWISKDRRAESGLTQARK